MKNTIYKSTRRDPILLVDVTVHLYRDKVNHPGGVVIEETEGGKVARAIFIDNVDWEGMLKSEANLKKAAAARRLQRCKWCGHARLFHPKCRVIGKKIGDECDCDEFQEEPTDGQKE